MARSVYKEDIWETYSVRANQGVIELREQRISELIIAALIVLLLPGCLALIFYINYGYLGLIQCLICLFAAWMMLYTCMSAMKMPRALRFYPAKKLIEKSCVIGPLRFRRQRVNLAKSTLHIYEVEYESTDELSDLDSSPKPFNLSMHFVDLLEDLFSIRSMWHLLRQNESKLMVQAFGLYVQTGKDGLLVVLQRRADLEDLIQDWFSSCEAI